MGAFLQTLKQLAGEKIRENILIYVMAALFLYYRLQTWLSDMISITKRTLTGNMKKKELSKILENLDKLLKDTQPMMIPPVGKIKCKVCHLKLTTTEISGCQREDCKLNVKNQITEKVLTFEKVTDHYRRSKIIKIESSIGINETKKSKKQKEFQVDDSKSTSQLPDGKESTEGSIE